MDEWILHGRAYSLRSTEYGILYRPYHHYLQPKFEPTYKQPGISQVRVVEWTIYPWFVPCFPLTKCNPWLFRLHPGRTKLGLIKG